VVLPTPVTLRCGYVEKLLYHVQLIRLVYVYGTDRHAVGLRLVCELYAFTTRVTVVCYVVRLRLRLLRFTRFTVYGCTFYGCGLRLIFIGRCVAGCLVVRFVTFYRRYFILRYGLRFVTFWFTVDYPTVTRLVRCLVGWFRLALHGSVPRFTHTARTPTVPVYVWLRLVGYGYVWLLFTPRLCGSFGLLF